ncbi:MAG TPA: AraC family transcriptional regulator [Vicinamibacterales bacterium]|nr:AraC family transcriptional regulator [Vicinamibacterales bacterium]
MRAPAVERARSPCLAPRWPTVVSDPLDDEGGFYAERSAVPSLARVVDAIWIAQRPRDGGEPRVMVPDAHADLILRLDAPGYPTRFELNGPPTRPFVNGEYGPRFIVAVRFRPGRAFPCFGVAMSELQNQRVSLCDLWPEEVAKLLDCVSTSTSLENTATLLESFLVERLGRSLSSEPSRGLARAMVALSADGRSARVREIAAALGISERHLRRKFEVVVGTSPKTFARIQRFRKALTILEKAPTPPHWASIASLCGYFDQAHLIHDFKRMTSVTPQQWYDARRR